MDKLPVDIATAEQPTPIITEAVPEHHAAIRRLLGDAYAGYAAAMPADVFPVYLADLLDITADDATLLVAVEDGVVVGTARLHLRPTSVGLPAGAAYVRGVAVRRDRLGTGVARALMTSCTDRARAAGADSMWLHTAAFMRPAIRLYEGLGYRRVPAYDTDSRRHYGLLSDPPLHAFAYRLDLAGFVDVGDGYRLWVQTAGAEDLPPMLLIMGANASGLGWPDELVARLAQHHRVVRYDHRDTGRSTRAFAERPYAIRTLADDAVAVLDALEITKANVYGLSLGGMVAQQIALRHPRRVRSLVLGATTPGGRRARIADEEVMEFFRGRAQLSREEAAWASVPYNYGRRCRDRHADRIAEDIRHRLAYNFDEAAYQAQLMAAALHNTTSRLRRVLVPALVVHGKDDRVVPVANGELIASRLPRGELHLLPDTGHLYTTEAPEADSVVARFLASVN